MKHFVKQISIKFGGYY